MRRHRTLQPAECRGAFPGHGRVEFIVLLYLHLLTVSITCDFFSSIHGQRYGRIRPGKWIFSSPECPVISAKLTPGEKNYEKHELYGLLLVFRWLARPATAFLPVSSGAKVDASLQVTVNLNPRIANFHKTLDNMLFLACAVEGCQDGGEKKGVYRHRFHYRGRFISLRLRFQALFSGLFKDLSPPLAKTVTIIFLLFSSVYRHRFRQRRGKASQQ